MEPSAPGWYPDPYGRHEHRYWSGVRWSRHVEDDGRRTQEPPPEQPVRLQRRAAGQLLSDPGLPARRLSPRPPPRSRVRQQTVLVAGGLTAVLIVTVSLVLLRRDSGGTKPDSVAADGQLLVAVVEVMRDTSSDTLSDVEAECMGRAVIDSAGATRLDELGVLDGTDPILALEPGEKAFALQRAFGCLDDPGLVDFISSTWAAGGLSADVAACVFEHWLADVGRDRMIELYVASAEVDPPPFNELLEPEEFGVSARAVQACPAPPAPATTLLGG